MRAAMQNDNPRPTHNLPKLLTPLEAAALLRISRARPYRLVETRTIPFYDVGRALCFSEDDLQAFLTDNRVDHIKR
jgi:excisionase family DNA binding protein